MHTYKKAFGIIALLFALSLSYSYSSHADQYESVSRDRGERDK